jgi:hypothetical protein
MPRDRLEETVPPETTLTSLPPARRVTVYHPEGCHLCDRAIHGVREAQGRMPFDLELVDIGGVESLEAEYREALPVIEIDGVRVFTYFVSVDGLLGRLEARGDNGSPARSPSDPGNM